MNMGGITVCMAASRRYLSLWFPRMGADMMLRRMRGSVLGDGALPFAVVQAQGPAQVLHSLSAGAERAGLRVGQPLRDAMAMCPDLVSRLRNAQIESRFLAGLRRWAGGYSPWVGQSGEAGLILDITGCAHLFNGEAAMLTALESDCTRFGLYLRAGIADSVGAAWALAHFAGPGGRDPNGDDVLHHRSGDAIDQEARATRSRAAKRRHWERGGTAPQIATPEVAAHPIAPPGQLRSVLAPLPLAALRLEDEMLAQLARLGLRRVGDLIGQPRGPLARRFGPGLILRMDQALGQVPEPVSPVAESRPFAVRMTLPDPIGLESDLLAGIDRLLPRLCDRLATAGRGVRLVRLQAYRSDHTMQWISAGLARATCDPDRIRPLLAMKVQEIDAGHGIDMLRIEAVQTEPISARQPVGHLAVTQAVTDRVHGAAPRGGRDADAGGAGAEHLEQAGGAGQAAYAGPTQTQTQSQAHRQGVGQQMAQGLAQDDLIARVGARVGMDAVTRWHPASSHIPEKTAQVLAAAWSEPAIDWPDPMVPRPLLLWPPEPVHLPAGVPETPHPPAAFRWRGRDLRLGSASGPERIAPEWWLDDPNWRSGTRDYWRVTVEGGDELWFYYAHGASMSSGWFCQGQFA